MHIDQYRFGTLVVDGREIHGDVLVTPAGVQEHWWRREGHVLRPEDLGTLSDPNLRSLSSGPVAMAGCGLLLAWSGNWRSAAWPLKLCPRPMPWTASTRC